MQVGLRRQTHSSETAYSSPGPKKPEKGCDENPLARFTV